MTKRTDAIKQKAQQEHALNLARTAHQQELTAKNNVAATKLVATNKSITTARRDLHKLNRSLQVKRKELRRITRKAARTKEELENKVIELENVKELDETVRRHCRRRRAEAEEIDNALVDRVNDLAAQCAYSERTLTTATFFSFE